MSTPINHEVRVSLRLSRDSKHRIECAAAVSGQSDSDFAASALTRIADDILERQNVIVLNDAERDFFLALLDKDEEPSEKAKAAAARYRRGTHKD